MAFANIPYYGKKKTFQKWYCSILSASRTAITGHYRSFVTCATGLCLSGPAPPSVPHLWLAAPQSLLLQTQSTKPFGLLSPHKIKIIPCLSSRAARPGGSHARVGTTAGAVCTPCAPLSIFNKPWARELVFPRSQGFGCCRFHSSYPSKEGSEPCGYCRRQDHVPALGRCRDQSKSRHSLCLSWSIPRCQGCPVPSR